MFLGLFLKIIIKALLLLQPFLRGKKNIGFPLQLLSCGKATYLRWQAVWSAILSCMVGPASLDSVCLWWPYWLVRASTLQHQLWHWRTVLILTIVKQLVWWVTWLHICTNYYIFVHVTHVSVPRHLVICDFQSFWCLLFTPNVSYFYCTFCLFVDCLVTTFHVIIKLFYLLWMCNCFSWRMLNLLQKKTPKWLIFACPGIFHFQPPPIVSGCSRNCFHMQ